MTLPAAERVALGAAMLDAALPGWARRIMLDRLDLADCSSCILGQLYRGFGPGVAALGLHGRLTEHGFRATRDVWWDALLAAWLAEIETRTGART